MSDTLNEKVFVAFAAAITVTSPPENGAVQSDTFCPTYLTDADFVSFPS